MNMACSACGAQFRSMIAEARHRHNFPRLCKRNKRFKAWETQLQMDRVADVIERYAEIAELALPQFNWGASALDGAAIAALSKMPNIIPVRLMIQRLRKGEL